MGHWTPTGIEPMDYDDDDDELNYEIVSIFIFGTKFPQIIISMHIAQLKALGQL